MKWLLLAAAVVTPSVTQAQTHVEVRTGMTIGSLSSSLAGLEIEPAISFDVLIRRDLTDWLTAYGAYSRLAYGCVNGFCAGSPRRVTGNHSVVGVGAFWKMLWLRTGVMAGVTSIHGAPDPMIGFGLQGAWGARFRAWDFELIPGFSVEFMQARYASSNDRAMAASFDVGVGYPLPF